MKLTKKIFNYRLQNDPESLKKIISGATKDIQELSDLILSLQKYRSQVSDFKGQL